MPKINISQAAKITGKTRTTIYKKIKSGELSAALGSDGNRLIDTAELLRVFGDLVTPDAVSMDVHGIQQETPQVTPLLERQISLLEAENKRLHEQIEADRREKERLLGLLEKQTLLLTHTQQEPAPKTTFWQRMFGLRG
jgi:hypothetical protein